MILQERLYAHGVVDSFDVCVLAHFVDVLYGDGNSQTTEHRDASGGSASGPNHVPLHLALRRARRAQRHGRAATPDEDAEGDAALNFFAPADDAQVTELARWLTFVFFDYRFRFARLKAPHYLSWPGDAPVVDYEVGARVVVKLRDGAANVLKNLPQFGTIDKVNFCRAC